MSALTVLQNLVDRGFTLRAVSGSLEVQPASTLTPNDRQAIRANRDVLVDLLEIVRELSRVGCGPDHPDHAEALAIASWFPGALETLRATSAPKVRP